MPPDKMPQTYSEKDSGFDQFLIVIHDEVADAFQPRTSPTASLSPGLPVFDEASPVIASVGKHTTDIEKCLTAEQWQPPTTSQLFRSYKILITVMTAYLLVSTTLTWYITFPGIYPRQPKKADYLPGPYARAFALNGLFSVPGTIIDLAWCFWDVLRITGWVLKQVEGDTPEEEIRKRRQEDHWRWHGRVQWFVILVLYHLMWTFKFGRWPEKL